jgi:dsRNA-specific ribonuclease
VSVAGMVIHTGSGKSKKEAEKQAAKKAWQELHNEKE